MPDTNSLFIIHQDLQFIGTCLVVLAILYAVKFIFWGFGGSNE